MPLKVNYKDDVFTGNRKYDLVENGDGTYSLVDQTTYTQEGDVFGASDINATNTAVNGKQEQLVSGTNIKTIGGASILGSGDMNVGIQYEVISTL